MRTNQRLLVLGVVMLLTVVGLWLASRRTNYTETGTPSRSPEPALSIEHHAERSRELTRRSPVTPTQASTTNAEQTNAADLYRKAFALMQELSEEENKTLADWKAEVDPIVAAELCGKLKPIMALAHQAAPLTNCDWGLKEATVDTPMKHLAPARALARAVVWNAAHCRQGDNDGVGDDIEAMLRAGQSTSQFLIGHLVNTAIQSLALEYLSVNAGTLSADVAARLSLLLGDDSYEESLFQALGMEADMVNQTADGLATMKPAQAQEKWKQLISTNDSPTMSQTEFVAAARQIAELEHEYARALGATDAEFGAWLEKLHAAEQSNPLLRAMWPTMDRIEEQTRTMIVRRTMVSAGLALLREGPSALQSRLDPATGQAFAYRQTATGFELQSAYLLKGKPLVVSFVSRP